MITAVIVQWCYDAIKTLKIIHLNRAEGRKLFLENHVQRVVVLHLKTPGIHYLLEKFIVIKSYPHMYD